MKLYYFKDKEGNFGDDLNPWLWQSLFPGLFDDDNSHLFIGVGTLLNHRIPQADKVTVFGSGHGYGSLPAITPQWQFYCVRGPMTAKALELSPELAITDPAALAPLFYTKQHQKHYPVSFMPHCDSARYGDWQDICKRAGVHYIDPRLPYMHVFAEICRSEHLLTEAMHGAILADAFRVPWTPVKAYSHISEYKWQDWLLSVGITDASFSSLPEIWRGDIDATVIQRAKNRLKYRLQNTALWRPHWQSPPPRRSDEKLLSKCAGSLAQLATNARSWLSTDNVQQQNTARLLEKASQLKQDFGC